VGAPIIPPISCNFLFKSRQKFSIAKSTVGKECGTRWYTTSRLKLLAVNFGVVVVESLSQMRNLIQKIKFTLKVNVSFTTRSNLEYLIFV